MDKKKTSITVRCTCCDAVLTVDRNTGDVLFTEKPKKELASFEEGLNRVKQEKETAEDRFREAFMREESRMKIVDKKFEEAMKRKDELEDPIRPMDLD